MRSSSATAATTEIPPKAWAQHDQAMAEWQERQREGGPSEAEPQE